MPQAGVAASDRFEANRLSLLATGAFRFTAPSKLDLPVSYKIFGSAKLYQWRKGDRETASRPTRVASQSGGLRNLHLGIGTGCRYVNGGNDRYQPDP